MSTFQIKLSVLGTTPANVELSACNNVRAITRYSEEQSFLRHDVPLTCSKNVQSYMQLGTHLQCSEGPILHQTKTFHILRHFSTLELRSPVRLDYKSFLSFKFSILLTACYTSRYETLPLSVQHSCFVIGRSCIQISQSGDCVSWLKCFAAFFTSSTTSH
jgi:hypothetical protein